MDLLTEQTDIIAADVMMERGMDFDYAKLDICSVITFGSLDLLKKAAQSNPEGLKHPGPLGERPLTLSLGLAKMDHALALLDYYEDFDEHDRFGHSPVQLIAKYSFQNAISPTVVAPRGEPATEDPDEAARRSEGYMNKCVKALKKMAPKVNLDDFTSYNYTALQCAAEEDNADIVQALADAGADLDKQNNDNSTALMIAVEKKKMYAMKALLKAGADPDISDNYGTPLIEAVRTKNREMIKLLRKHNASTEIPVLQKYSGVEKGETASGYAKRIGDEEIIRLLD